MEAQTLRLCRDCLRRCPRDSSRCAHCGSPRTVDLEAAEGLAIAHVDCDAFYAAVEKRDDASLRDKPVIVGGSGPRAVVATCCYIARTFGVRSAMPMSRARSLCPDAIILPPDMAKYSRVGSKIRARMLELAPLVEPLSIDEAFLDLTGCEGPNGASAAETLVRFAQQIELETGVTVSVGLSYCKFLAKLASDLDKPRGFALIRREDAKAWLAPQRIGRLWGPPLGGGRRPGWGGVGGGGGGGGPNASSAWVFAQSAICSGSTSGRRSRGLGTMASGFGAWRKVVTIARSSSTASPKAFRARRHSIATSATKLSSCASCLFIAIGSQRACARKASRLPE